MEKTQPQKARTKCGPSFWKVMKQKKATCDSDQEAQQEKEDSRIVEILKELEEELVWCGLHWQGENTCRLKVTEKLNTALMQKVQDKIERENLKVRINNPES